MKDLGKDVPAIAVAIIVGAVIRLAIAPFFMDTFDFAFWTATAFDIRTGNGMYSDYDYWYPPVWGYILSLMVPILDLFNCIPTEEIIIRMADDDLSTGDGWAVSTGALVILKLPLIAADLVNGLLIYKIVKRISGDERKSMGAATLWLFNPLSIWISSGHGQFDTVALMFVLLCIYAYLEGSRLMCGMAIAAATLTKVFPAFMVLPMFALILTSGKDRGIDIKGGCLYAIGGIGMTLIILLPQIINGELQFVTSFLTGRLFDSHPVPSGFDPVAMSFFSDNIYPRTGRSTYLLPSFLLTLILTVFMAIRRPEFKKGLLLLTASLCIFLIWFPAPGYSQYYIVPVGMLCLCSCLDRRFGYLAMATALLCSFYLITCFGYAVPMVTMGLMDLDTLFSIERTLNSIFWVFDGFVKFLQAVPMLLAVILAIVINRRCADES